uniref:5'-3' exonuclease domain-containing protein n=1 Tax=Chaetoceros debilis TaxID=122233 RepID=A0A7S3VCJ6_9STRA
MMMRGRRMPPPVMEYDYSHYDEEFGARKAGEGTNIEFHDGMLEDIDGDGNDDGSIGSQSISGSITQSQSNSNNGMLEITITNEEEKIAKDDYSSTTIEKNSIEFELPEETSSLEQQTKTYEYTEEIITSETTKISMDGKVEVDADERMPTTSESIDTTSGPHYSGQVKDEPEPSRDTDTKESWRNSFARQSQMRMPSRPTANGAGVGTGAGTNTSKPVKVEVAYSAPTGGADPNSLSMLESQLEQFQTEMFALNDGKEFNIKSPKQVSVVLFGVDNESTNKDALDAIAGNVSDHTKSRLASLVLKYRKTLSQIKRVQKTKENKANGTHTTPLNSMKKGNGRLDGTAAVTAMESNKPDANEKTAIGQVVVSPMNASTTDEEPLVLVDASAYIFRAYYSMPPMHRDDGEPIGATLGFCNMLNKLVLTPLLQGKRPRIILVFDSKSGTNFRKKIYPEYKANRSACPEDLIPQFDFVRDAADAYGILQLEAPGFEADDVVATIGTMAVKEGCYVNILSGDKDLMQLVTKSENGGPCIEMIDPMKMVRFCHDTVKEKWGVEPSLLGDILALAGDSADNIPGVPGIGPKIAASLIQEYGSLDGLLENVEQVKQKGRQKNLKDNAHLARLSRELVELDRNISLEDMSFPTHYQNISDIRMESFDKDRLIKFYETMGLHELKRRVTSRLPKKRNGRAPSGFDRYASITEQLPEQHFRSSKSVKTEENDQGFSTPSTFKKPPTPEDFSDVPF